MPADRPASRWGLVAALVLALAVQLYVLYSPGSPTPRPLPFPHSDKLIHIAIFALPAMLVWLLERSWWPVIVMLVHVPISELVQQVWIPYRGGDWIDAIADLAGVGLGVLAAALVLRWTPPTRPRPKSEETPES